MFALAASNMILRGDGKANLYQGSCFDDAITSALRDHKCDVGMVNPPYSQGDSDLHELRFIKHMLDCLVPGAVGIAIVPMWCAISPHPVRRELLKEHTLEAVMSMPDELFYPVGVITSIMVFTAHHPHAASNKKTWFGYWKNDAFMKTKHRGRIDIKSTWPERRDRWVEAFRNREVLAGESILQRVGVDDEWCAEAYMETDYKKLMPLDFEHIVKNYAVYRLLGGRSGDAESPELFGRSWGEFTFESLFDLRKGRRLTKANMRPGTVKFVGAIDSNNGVAAFVETAIHEGGTLTVNYNGAGVAEAFFQAEPFWASDDVNVLYPKFPMNPAVALFIAAIIKKEKYRFSYGRKWHLERMRTSTLHLPTTPSGDPDWVFMERFMKCLPYSREALAD